MQRIGYLMVAAGFLAGAFATSLDVENVRWNLFIVAAIVATAGLITVKRQAAAHARSEAVLETNRGELRESIGNVVRDIAQIRADGAARGARLRDQIDLRLRNDLRRFADARESMVHLFGLQTYADIMSCFAAGERYINRVWSASADGYDEEASLYLGKAEEQFGEAERQLLQAAAKG